LTKKNPQDFHERELDTILLFGTLINSSLNIEEVLENAMKWAEEFMEAEASSIFELDQEKEELFIRLARGEKKDSIKGIKIQVGEGITGRVVENGQPMVIPDVSKEKRFVDKYDKLTGFKTRSMICVPLISRGKPVGALQVLNKKFKKLFTQGDLKLLTGMAQQIAVAMENAKLYQRLEKKFESTAQALNTTQIKLIRSERLTAIGHLVQGIAHEIRNPITTIGGFANRIKKNLKNDQKLEKYIDIILDETSRLEKLVGQVREFSAVQSAYLSLDNITSVIDEVVKRFVPSARRQGVKIVMDMDDDAPFLEMDSPQMVSALSHVMENALESMPEGGRLTLAMNRANDNILLSICDTGCGIAPDQLTSVYDPFVTSKTKGAGLGLTMVYQIIKNHHGEIKISSQIGQGTIVTIQLPIPKGQ
jgi:signal transduction histidine kinase